MVGEKNLRTYLDKFDRKYWATYKVLDILQKVSKASFCAGTPVLAGAQSQYLRGPGAHCDICASTRRCSTGPTPPARPLLRCASLTTFRR